MKSFFYILFFILLSFEGFSQINFAQLSGRNTSFTCIAIGTQCWMVRNLDHRIEVACPIFDNAIQEELTTILKLQMQENVKGRILDNDQTNKYVISDENTPEMRSQIEIYHYLRGKKYNS